MTRHIAMLCLVFLASCGPDLPCARYDDAALPHERAMLDDLATVFVDLGYEEPCCPVHFCRAGESCQGLIENCGAIRMSGDECKQIWVDASRERCTDQARTAAHEGLHAIGYMHGKDMDEAQDRILGEYRGRCDA